MKRNFLLPLVVGSGLARRLPKTTERRGTKRRDRTPSPGATQGRAPDGRTNRSSRNARQSWTRAKKPLAAAQKTSRCYCDAATARLTATLRILRQDNAAARDRFLRDLLPQTRSLWRLDGNGRLRLRLSAPQATQSRDWRPYTNGHWIYTDAGWTWISDEPFGWATYHYGRWIRLRGFGWVWVPGEQWAPAWVSWRKGNDYVGWAPLPPEARFDRQTGIRNWADNYYDIGPEQYTFVPANAIRRANSARSEILPPERNVTIINQTINVTNIIYNNSVMVDQGPSYDDLRAQSTPANRAFPARAGAERFERRPVFKGEVVALPTIDFRAAERAARPNRVARTIEQTVVGTRLDRNPKRPGRTEGARTK